MNKPDFSFEKRYWQRGYQMVIGVDEVGRGAFAGPVVAAAAALKIDKITRPHYFVKVSISSKETVMMLGINDSKKLSPQKRARLVPQIKKYFYWGIGETSASLINKLGIVKTTEKAMRRAIKDLIVRNPNFKIPNSKQINNSKNQLIQKNSLKIENFKLKIPKQTAFVLVDAFHVKYIPGIGLTHQKAIIKGDGKSISIAAASVLAKVYRDRLMTKLGRRYRKYRWQKNKGYGTREHREAILKSGITKLHRENYVDSWLNKQVIYFTYLSQRSANH